MEATRHVDDRRQQREVHMVADVHDHHRVVEHDGEVDREVVHDGHHGEDHHEGMQLQGARKRNHPFHKQLSMKFIFEIFHNCGMKSMNFQNFCIQNWKRFNTF